MRRARYPPRGLTTLRSRWASGWCPGHSTAPLRAQGLPKTSTAGSLEPEGGTSTGHDPTARNPCGMRPLLEETSIFARIHPCWGPIEASGPPNVIDRNVGGKDIGANRDLARAESSSNALPHSGFVDDQDTAVHWICPGEPTGFTAEDLPGIPPEIWAFLVNVEF